jgi:hypothetical protein
MRLVNSFIHKCGQRCPLRLPLQTTVSLLLRFATAARPVGAGGKCRGSRQAPASEPVDGQS